jgi:hypothetical protein
MSLTFLENLCFRKVLMSLKDASGEKMRVKWIHMSDAMAKPTTLSRSARNLCDEGSTDVRARLRLGA